MVSDDFNRADGSPGANWETVVGAGGEISSNAITGTDADYSGSRYNAVEFNAAQTAQVLKADSGVYVGAAVRMSPGSGGNFYAFWQDGVLEKMVNGSASTMASGWVNSVSGDTTRIEVNGTTGLEGKVNGSSVGTHSDGSLATGKPGYVCYGDASAKLDDWQGTGEHAWTLEEGFEGYTAGNLNGQGGWSGSTSYQVQTSVTYAGGKAGSIAISDGLAITKDLPFQIHTGSFYWAARRSGNTTSDFDMILREDSTNKVFVRFDRNGNITYFDGSVFNTLAAYSVDTWYPLNVEFNDDTQPDKFRVRVYSGGSWGSFSPWTTTNGAYGAMHAIRFDCNGSGGGTAYFDAISASDITASGGGVTPSPDAGVLAMLGRGTSLNFGILMPDEL